MARTRLDDSTRDDILDAVDLLLERYGYGKMAIADVAREAGIGKGTVYLFFPSKEELVLSAIDRIAERLLTESQAIAEGPGSLITRLRRCLLVRVLARFDGAQSHTPSLAAAGWRRCAQRWQQRRQAISTARRVYWKSCWSRDGVEASCRSWGPEPPQTRW